MFANIRYILGQPAATEIKRERKKPISIFCNYNIHQSYIFVWSMGWLMGCRIFFGIIWNLEIFNSLLVIRACNHPLEDNFHIFPESISENMEIYWAQPKVILSAALSKYHLRALRGTGLFVQRGNIQIHINDNGFVHAFSVVVCCRARQCCSLNKQTEVIHLYQEIEREQDYNALWARIKI